MDDVEHVHHLLAQARGDFARRTVVSRAYYCAYPRVTAYAVAGGFRPNGRGIDHSAVVAFLAQSGGRNATIAARLKALHQLRKWADYRRELPLRPGAVGMAVDMMDDMIAAIVSAGSG